MKSDRFWVIIFSAVVLVCLAAALYISNAPGSVAVIYQDGELIDSIDLTAQVNHYTVTIYAKGGGVNVIEVQRGRIRVARADCGGGDCVHQGWVSGGLTPIVCLPHGLVIRVEGSSDIDGVVG